MNTEYSKRSFLQSSGGNPAHGDIPEPPPKSKALKPLSDDDEVRAIQCQQRSETTKRNIDYERSNTPSGNITKVRIMRYDSKHLFMGYVKVYLKLAKQNEPILNKPAPTPYLADDDKDYDEDNEPKGQLQSIAAKVILNILYGARLARYDLLHSCQIWACVRVC